MDERSVTTEVDSLADAHLLRRQPYVLLFPLGAALAAWGVGHWLLWSLGLIVEYRPIFHALVQIQGFLTCFATGFLFTMVPRRTGTSPPTTLEIGLATLAPVGVGVAAWVRSWSTAQVIWLVLVAVVLAFVTDRFLSMEARRRPPTGFVWIPAGLLMGVAGSVATLAGPYAWRSFPWLHTLGQGLVLQGLFIGLVLGVGTLALPLMTRGEAPEDAGRPGDVWVVLAHSCAALLVAASFWIEVTRSLRLGLAIRGLVVLAVFVVAIRLWRLPRRPGWNAWLIWSSAWLLPAGFLLAAALPRWYRAGLHVSFVGGLGLLALAVGMQVSLGHGGYRELQLGRPWQIPTIGALLLSATLARYLMAADETHRVVWMAVAASLFLLGLALWAVFILPRMRSRGPGHGTPARADR